MKCLLPFLFSVRKAYFRVLEEPTNPAIAGFLVQAANIYQYEEYW